jgi:FtsP/CotA-like multicopper oxidase with cupredoxin domain
MWMSRRTVLAGLLTAGAGSCPALAGAIVELRAGPIPTLPIFSTAGLWGFNGTVPGPSLHARRGEEFRVRVYNEIDEPIGIHWHGVRVPNRMDGTPLTQAPVEPGSVFDYVFVPPDAGTFWYHTTWNSSVQRERGLYGILIVDEDHADEATHDLPMIIDDWKLNATGALDEASFHERSAASGQGRIGNLLTVNGAARPMLFAPANKHLRLRMLNAANARFLNLKLTGAAASVIANDGQPVRAAKPSQSVALLPGQRTDLLVPAGPSPLSLALEEPEETIELAEIVREGALLPEAPPPKPLKSNPLPDYFNYAALHDVTFTIEGGAGSTLQRAYHEGVPRRMSELAERGLFWAVNGNAGLASEPLFRVQPGVTVAITVDNITRVSHVLHIHGHAARLVEVAGRAVTEPVWRDTFLVRPLEPAKIMFIADNPGRWLIASAVAEHFDSGLQAWFEVR